MTHLSCPIGSESDPIIPNRDTDPDPYHSDASSTTGKSDSEVDHYTRSRIKHRGFDTLYAI